MSGRDANQLAPDHRYQPVQTIEGIVCSYCKGPADSPRHYGVEAMPERDANQLAADELVALVSTLQRKAALHQAGAEIGGQELYDRWQAAEAALATTRQALELLLEWAEKDRGGGYPEANRSEEWYTHRDFARRALAVADGDTKEPA